MRVSFFFALQIVYVGGFALISGDINGTVAGTQKQYTNLSNIVLGNALAYDGTVWSQLGQFMSEDEAMLFPTYASLFVAQSTHTLFGIATNDYGTLDQWGDAFDGFLVYDVGSRDWISIASASAYNPINFSGLFPSPYVEPGYLVITGNFDNITSNFASSIYTPINSLPGPLGGTASLLQAGLNPYCRSCDV